MYHQLYIVAICINIYIYTLYIAIIHNIDRLPMLRFTYYIVSGLVGVYYTNFFNGLPALSYFPLELSNGSPNREHQLLSVFCSTSLKYVAFLMIQLSK